MAQPARSGNAERIRRHYGVPAKVGMEVTIGHMRAKIVGFSRTSMHLRVRFLDEPVLGIRNAHPKWGVVYPEDP